MAAWAEAYYVLVAPHNVGGPVATAAALHLAAATPNFKILEHFNDFAEAWVKRRAPGNPRGRRRLLRAPDGPGLGVTLDLDVVAATPAPRRLLQPLRRGLAAPPGGARVE